jgi:hypothetical protein
MIPMLTGFGIFSKLKGEINAVDGGVTKPIPF